MQATDNEVGAEGTRILKAYVDCRDKNAALIDRINKLGGDRE